MVPDGAGPLDCQPALQGGRHCHQRVHLRLRCLAAGRCLQDSEVKVPDAIIAGTGLGMMQDTEKFLTSILDNDEQFLTPTSFIQSTHNTVGAHIAVMLKCNKYNLTYVNENLSFESALLDALIRLDDNPKENILLAGIDELTDAYFTITDNARFWKKKIVNNAELFENTEAGSIAGEGAVFFMLNRQKHPDNYARFKGVHTFYKPGDITVTEGFIRQFLLSKGLQAADIDLVITGMNGDPDGDKVFQNVLKNVFPDTVAACYKHLCGEYHTSSAFAAWLAAMILKTKKLPEGILLEEQLEAGQFENILIYNQANNTNHALILLSAC